MRYREVGPRTFVDSCATLVGMLVNERLTRNVDTKVLFSALPGITSNKPASMDPQTFISAAHARSREGACFKDEPKLRKHVRSLAFLLD